SSTTAKINKYEAQNINSNKMQSNLERKLATLKDSISQLRGEYNLSQADNSKLQSDIEKYDAEREALDQQLSFVNSNQRKLKTSHQSALDKNLSLIKSINASKTQIKRLHSEINSQKAQIDVQKQQSSKNVAQQKSFLKINKELKEKVGELDALLHSTSAKIEKYEAQNINAVTTKNNLERELTSLKDSISSLRGEYSFSQTNVTNLQSEVKKYAGEKKALTKLFSDIKINQNELKKSHQLALDENQALAKSINASTNQITDLRSEIKDRQAHIADQKTQNLKNEKENASLQSQNIELQSKIVKLDNALSATTTQIKEFEVQKKNQESQIELLSKEKQQLANDILIANNKINQAERGAKIFKADTLSLRRDLEVTLKNEGALKDSLETVNKDLVTTNQALNKSKKEYAQTSSQLVTLSENASELRTRYQDVDESLIKSQNNVQRLERELASLGNNLSSEIKSHTQSKQMLNDLQKNQSALESSLIESDATQDRLSKNVDKLNNQLKQTESRLNKSESNTSALQSNLEQSQEIEESLNKDIAKLNTRIQQSLLRFEVSEKQRSSLEDEIKTIALTKGKLQQQINELVSNLNESNQSNADLSKLNQKSNKQLVTTQATIKSLETSIDNSVNQNKEISQDLAKQKIEAMKLQGKLDKSKKQLERITNQSKKYLEEIDTREKQIQELSQSRNNLTHLLEVSDQKRVSLQEVLREQNTIKEDLAESNTNYLNEINLIKNNLKAATNSKTKLSADLNSTNAKLQISAKKITGLEQQLSSVNNNQKKSNESIAKLKTELEVNLNKIPTLQTDKTSLSNQLSKSQKYIDEVTSQLNSANQNNENNTQKIKDAKQSENALKQDLKSVKSEINVLESKLESANATINNMGTKLNQAIASNDKITNQLDKQKILYEKSKQSNIDQAKEIAAQLLAYESSQNKSNDLQKMLDTATEELQAYKKQIKLSTNEYNKLARLDTQTQQSLKNVQDKLERENSKSNLTEKTIAKLKANTKTLEATIENNKATIEVAKSTYMKLRNSNDQIQNELNHDNQLKAKEIASLINRNNSTKSNLERSRKNEEAFQSRLNLLQNSLQSADKQLRATKNDFVESTKKMSLLLESVKEQLVVVKASDLAKAKQVVQLQAQYEQEIKSNVENIEKITSAADTKIQLNRAQLSKKMDILKASNATLVKKVDDTNNRLAINTNKLKASLNNKDMQLSKIEQSRGDANSQIKSIRNQIQVLETDKQKLNKEFNESQSINADLSKQISALKGALSSANSDIKSYDELKKQQEEILKRLSKENNGLSLNLSSAEERITKIAQETKEFKEETLPWMKELKFALQNEDKLKESLTNVNNSLGKTNEALIETKEERAQMARQLETLRSNEAELRNRYFESTKTLSKSEKYINELEAEVTKLRVENDRSKIDNKLNRENIKVGQLLKKLKVTNQELTNIQNVSDDLTKTNSKLNERLSQLDASYSAKLKKTELLLKNRQNELALVQNNVKELNSQLDLNKRNISAEQDRNTKSTERLKKQIKLTSDSNKALENNLQESSAITKKLKTKIQLLEKSNFDLKKNTSGSEVRVLNKKITRLESSIQKNSQIQQREISAYQSKLNEIEQELTTAQKTHKAAIGKQVDLLKTAFNHEKQLMTTVNQLNDKLDNIQKDNIRLNKRNDDLQHALNNAIREKSTPQSTPERSSRSETTELKKVKATLASTTDKYESSLREKKALKKEVARLQSDYAKINRARPSKTASLGSELQLKAIVNKLNKEIDQSNAMNSKLAEKNNQLEKELNKTLNDSSNRLIEASNNKFNVDRKMSAELMSLKKSLMNTVGKYEQSEKQRAQLEKQMRLLARDRAQLMEQLEVMGQNASSLQNQLKPKDRTLITARKALDKSNGAILKLKERYTLMQEQQAKLANDFRIRETDLMQKINLLRNKNIQLASANTKIEQQFKNLATQASTKIAIADTYQKSGLRQMERAGKEKEELNKEIVNLKNNLGRAIQMQGYAQAPPSISQTLLEQQAQRQPKKSYTHDEITKGKKALMETFQNLKGSEAKVDGVSFENLGRLSTIRTLRLETETNVATVEPKQNYLDPSKYIQAKLTLFRPERNYMLMSFNKTTDIEVDKEVTLFANNKPVYTASVLKIGDYNMITLKIVGRYEQYDNYAKGDKFLVS
ncbi:MAG: chromosome segregation ATPase, partial [Candidatus Omnitrophota bacterium]